MKTKKNDRLAIPLFLIAATLSSQGSLLLHWKLDEANGDYTGGGYREEVTGNTDITKEVSSGTSVTEGEPGLAPDGGTSMRFVDTDPDSYLDAGSVEDDGTWASGPAANPLVLGGNLTLTAWFHAEAISGQDSIVLSNQFSAGTGFMFGPRSTNLFMDFGNTRASYPANLQAGQDYFVAVRMDLNGDTNFGWEANANHRISLRNLSDFRVMTASLWCRRLPENGGDLSKTIIGGTLAPAQEWTPTARMQLVPDPARGLPEQFRDLLERKSVRPPLQSNSQSLFLTNPYP